MKSLKPPNCERSLIFKLFFPHIYFDKYFMETRTVKLITIHDIFSIFYYEHASSFPFVQAEKNYDYLNYNDQFKKYMFAVYKSPLRSVCRIIIIS